MRHKKTLKKPKRNMQKYKTKKMLTNKKSKKVKKVKKVKKGKKSKKSKSQSGGYGKGTNPLIGNPWNVDSGYYYKHSPYGLGVGGPVPYYGTGSPMPQHGGSLIPTFLSRPMNELSNNLGNLNNMYKGVRANSSSYPWNQNLQPK